MPKQDKTHKQAEVTAWSLDQLAKSQFFHRKLHEWKLIETAEKIEAIEGEALAWSPLNISDIAWNKVIHRGIKPVRVFAHPHVLQTVVGATAYYRMLAMVSQKSMNRIGSILVAYEEGRKSPSVEIALTLAQHFNAIISALIEADAHLNAREFDLWRGMAAGAQAQGSWQNNKGSLAEIEIRLLIMTRLNERGLIQSQSAVNVFTLLDGRTVMFSDEPDVAIYADGVTQIAVEVKGGIDSAGVLERLGAALKSLQRARMENPQAITILIAQEISLTRRALDDLQMSIGTVTHVFTVSAILNPALTEEQERFFNLLGI